MKYMIRLTTLISILFVSLYANAGAISGKAADFTLKSNTGKNLRLSDFRGQVVMLNFWASWCGPCRQEMPILDQLHTRYAKLGFTMLGVNVEEDSSKANAYLKDIPVSFPILYDTANQTSKLYNVSAMPTTVIIDRNGNMRFIHHGYKPGYENDYKKQIKALIRE